MTRDDQRIAPSPVNLISSALDACNLSFYKASPTANRICNVVGPILNELSMNKCLVPPTERPSNEWPMEQPSSKSLNRWSNKERNHTFESGNDPGVYSTFQQCFQCENPQPKVSPTSHFNPIFMDQLSEDSYDSSESFDYIHTDPLKEGEVHDLLTSKVTMTLSTSSSDLSSNFELDDMQPLNARMQRVALFRCRARGMGEQHQKSAQFYVPLNVRHGDELRCSHEACRNQGPKFCFCAICLVPAARRNFKTRHSHPEATSCVILGYPLEDYDGEIIEVNESILRTPATSKSINDERREPLDAKIARSSPRENLKKTSVSCKECNEEDIQHTPTKSEQENNSRQTPPLSPSSDSKQLASKPNLISVQRRRVPPSHKLLSSGSPIPKEWLDLYHRRPLFGDKRATREFLHQIIQFSESRCIPNHSEDFIACETPSPTVRDTPEADKAAIFRTGVTRQVSDSVDVVAV